MAVPQQSELHPRFYLVLYNSGSFPEDLQQTAKVKVYSLKSALYTIFKSQLILRGFEQSYFPWENTMHMSYNYAGSLSHSFTILVHQVLITAGYSRQRQYEMRSLTSSEKLNPRLFDLELRAPTQVT